MERQIHDPRLAASFNDHRAGRLAAAESGYRSVLAAHPQNAAALHLLGVLLQQTNPLDEGLLRLREAVAIAPDSAEFNNSLGAALSRAGKPAEGVAYLRRAVELKPDYAEAHGNLGLTLSQLGQTDDAIAEFRRAAELKAADADAHHRLGNALRSAGHAQQALAAHRRAVALRPGFAAAHHGVASDLCELGRGDEGIDAYRARLALEPDSRAAFSDLLFALHYSDRYSPEDLRREALEYERRFAGGHSAHAAGFSPSLGNSGEGRGGGCVENAPLARTPSLTLPRSTEGGDQAHLPTAALQAIRSTSARLRIGYISPDFRRHTIRHIIEPILDSHDRNAFEVFCYASVARPDDVTLRLKALAEHWIDIANLDDDRAAALIAEDRIDILVDLAGHMGGNRLGVLQRRPAPIQVQIGYPGTTGLSAISYRVADAHSAPPRSEASFTEKMIRLPDCAWPYKPPDDAPDVGPLPARSNGYITFGCLNKLVKASPRSLQLWADVLRAVTNSRLILLSPTKNDYIREFFASCGISDDRVELAPR